MLTTTMIGNKIAEARKKVNISQSQLAERLFISSQAVGKWERGESMPDIITFGRLSEILGVDLNYFSENFQSNVVISSDESFGKQPVPGKVKKKLIWDMSEGNWVDADFSGLKNLNEKFSSSNLQRCLFINSDLSRLHLKSNNVDRCDFSNSDISNSHIQNSNLVNNQFKNCSLTETIFSGSSIMGSDLSGANFTGTVFKSGALQKSPVVNAIWNRTSFNTMYIADMVFEGTFEDCSFENCEFARVTFQNSTIIKTFFKNKSLKRIRFIDCKVDNITHAFLKNGKADMTGISLLSQ